MNIIEYLPAKARAVIYALFGTVMSVEGALDAFDYGFIPERAQGAAFAVATVFGFGMAFKKTADIKTTTVMMEEEPGDKGLSAIDVLFVAAIAFVICVVVIWAV